ncbi:MAG: hypothetical protein ACRECR_04040, partial [Thermoplasmata archaeon]
MSDIKIGAPRESREAAAPKVERREELHEEPSDAPPSRPDGWEAPRRDYGSIWIVPTVIAVATIAILAVLVSSPLVGLGGISSSQTQALAQLPGGGSVCSPGSRIASAIDILQPDPVHPIPSGAVLSAAYEFEDANYTSSHKGVTVSVPVTQALFPLVGGTDASVSIPAHSSSLSGPGWSSPISANVTEGAGHSFAPAPQAQFVTEGYYAGSPVSDAVQATAPYGNLTLEFRWQWQLTEPNGTVYNGTWTVPSWTASNPELPSIFYPAASVASSSETGKVAMGGTFTDNLTGYVAGTTFTLTFQTSAGVILNTVALRSPTIVTGTYGASIPIVSAAQELSAGWYIFHVIDRCGALVQDTWFDVVYSSTAAASVGINPSVCGPISLGASSYSNDSVAIVHPSATPIPISAPACTGYSFAGWNATGGLRLSSLSSNSTTELASWSGNLTATYGTSSAIMFQEAGLATGYTWNVTLGGVTRSANPGQSIGLTISNGTYKYTIGSDWPSAASPTRGVLVYNGTARFVNVTFTAMNITHVVVIIDENSDLDTVLSYAPYMDYLWNTYGD